MNKIPHEIIHMAKSGSLVIFSSNRQFTEVKKILDQKSNDPNSKYPKITTIDSWVTYQFNNHFPEHKIISNYQAKVLFEKIISSSKYGHSLSNVPAAAESSLAALRTLISHNVLNEQATVDSLETEAFKEWRAIFEEHLQKRKMLLLESAIKEVTNLFLDEDFHISKRVIEYGFLKKTPIVENLLNKIKEHAHEYTVSNESSSNVSGSFKRECKTVNEEITSCITFIKSIQERQPDASICITSPVLADIKDKLSYELLRSFKSLTDPIDDIAEISVGTPMFDLPEIQTLLQIINHKKGSSLKPAEMDFIKQTGCCFFPANPEEFIGPPVRANEYGDSIEDHCKYVTDTIEDYQWCKKESSSNEQLTAKLNEVVEIVKNSDITNSEIIFSNFIFRIQDILKNTPFKLKSEKKTNISILGIYETIGLNFDFVWLIGANADYWPNKIQPNRFISSITDENNSITLKDEGEALFFKEISSRLTASCYEFYYSYSLYSSDKELLKPSTFSSENELFIQSEDKPFISPVKVSQELINDYLVEEIEDNSKCPRGTGYIEAFNQCPFMAHYTSRFPILRNIDDSSFSENKAHGDLIHFALEEFWSKHKASSYIKTISTTELELEVSDILTSVINKYKKNKHISDWFYDNEFILCTKLLTRFLILESSRNFIVEKIEKRSFLELATLRFTVFIDRIEKETVTVNIEKDKKKEPILKSIDLRIVSDHKTSDVTPSDWFKIPCPKPQIPIYSTLEESDGAIFNIIRPDTIAYKGVVRDGLGADLGIRSARGMKADWQTQCESWKTQLTDTVKKLKKGLSIPQPYSDDTCKFCTMKKACRIKKALYIKVDSEDAE